MVNGFFGMEERGFDIIPGSHPIVPVMIRDSQKAQQMADDLSWDSSYADMMEEMNEGLDESFAESRAEAIVAVRRAVGKAKDVNVANKTVWGSLDEMYASMANNKLGSAKVFPEGVHNYLEQKFGNQLADYLQWHNLLFAAFDTMRPELSEWLDFNNYGMPGQSFEAELKRQRNVENHSAGSKFTHFAVKGYMPYLRCGCGEIQLREIEGQSFRPGDYESNYRWHELSFKQKRIKPKKKAAKKKKPRRMEGGAAAYVLGVDPEESEESEEEEGEEEEGEEKKKKPPGVPEPEGGPPPVIEPGEGEPLAGPPVEPVVPKKQDIAALTVDDILADS